VRVGTVLPGMSGPACFPVTPQEGMATHFAKRTECGLQRSPRIYPRRGLRRPSRAHRGTPTTTSRVAAAIDAMPAHGDNVLFAGAR
jgi:hypothetical protein